MDKQRLGIIGCGMIVEVGHLAAWKRLSGQVEIVGIADRSAKRLKIVGEKSGVPQERRFADYQEMLEQLKPDFVDIALPHHLHKEAVIACCKLGVNVLLEKPVALKINEVLEITDAVKKSGIIFSPIHNYRTISLNQAALAAVALGTIGQPFLVRMEIIWPESWLGVADGFSPGWRSSAKAVPIGAINEYAYHNLYLAAEYMQSPVKTVFARTAKTDAGFSGENIAVITLEHESGGITVIQAGYGASKFARSDEIHGKKGSLALRFGDDEKPLIFFDLQGAGKTLPVQGNDDWGFDGCFEQYVNYLGGAVEVLPATVEQGLKISRIINAAYRSIQNNKCEFV